MLVHKIHRQTCIDLKVGDIQEVFNSYTAELTEDLWKVRVLCKPEDDEYSEAVLESSRLTNALNKELQMVDDLAQSFLWGWPFHGYVPEI